MVKVTYTIHFTIVSHLKFVTSLFTLLKKFFAFFQSACLRFFGKKGVSCASTCISSETLLGLSFFWSELGPKDEDWSRIKLSLSDSLSAHRLAVLPVNDFSDKELKALNLSISHFLNSSFIFGISLFSAFKDFSPNCSSVKPFFSLSSRWKQERGKLSPFEESPWCFL